MPSAWSSPPPLHDVLEKRNHTSNGLRSPLIPIELEPADPLDVQHYLILKQFSIMVSGPGSHLDLKFSRRSGGYIWR